MDLENFAGVLRMSKNAITVLDHIDGISVPGDMFSTPVNEYWALIWLRQGMEFLYHQASHYDRALLQSLNLAPNVRLEMFGNSPQFGTIPKGLLTCAFHWYAMSAYQYVLTVGAIARDQDITRPIPPHYVHTVMPDVLAFRNKVAAHFAWAKDNDRDNDAERLASILPQLSFRDGSIHIGGFTIELTRRGERSTSEALKAWSLCKVHERLRERYWPTTGGGAGVTAMPAG